MMRERDMTHDTRGNLHYVVLNKYHTPCSHHSDRLSWSRLATLTRTFTWRHIWVSRSGFYTGSLSILPRCLVQSSMLSCSFSSHGWERALCASRLPAWKRGYSIEP